QAPGLGLGTGYGIVRQSGGAIDLRSTPGAGTRVRIDFPRGEGARAAVPALDHASSRGVVSLVEDGPRVRTQARRLLQRAGYEVLEASDGAQGSRIFGERRADVTVVVTDVVMPFAGGIEMVSSLRAVNPSLPVVFVSGYT